MSARDAKLVRQAMDEIAHSVQHEPTFFQGQLVWEAGDFDRVYAAILKAITAASMEG